jgi:arylsulfatase A-like enzyme
LRDGKNSLWEGGVRVPFVVKGPGISGGTVSLELVIGYDIYPTIAKIVGIETPSDIDGGSFLHILQNEGLGKVQRKNAPGLVWHMPFHHALLHLNVQSAIRIGNYKYIRDWATDTGHLFNVDIDFREQYDLTTKIPGKTMEMKKALMDYLKMGEAEKPEYKPEHLNNKKVMDLRKAQTSNVNNIRVIDN